MAFYPPDADVPAGLRTDEFLLRMLRATDVELDYDAVMDSRDILVLRNGGRWPREGFTLAENLADLQGHERDHHARTSFTFTVLSPDETRCLGCVYINPLKALLERHGAGTAREGEAWVTFWLRPALVAQEMDRRLLAALHDWFPREWAFLSVVFACNDAQPREREIYEDAGLYRIYTLGPRDGANEWCLYG